MRRLVKTVLAGVVLGGISMGAVGATHAAGARPFVTGRYELSIDNTAAGFVTAVSGGEAYSDVVEEKLGPDHVVKKHIAGVKYEDVTVQAGTGMSRGFYQWIKDTFDKKYTRKMGAIQALDANDKEVQRLNFTNAVITEIGFPACDAASKDAAKLTLKLKPETTRRVGGTNATVTQHEPNQKAKVWTPADFKLTFSDSALDASRVNKIEAITIKQKIVENAVGQMRDYQQEPAHLEIPNLVITLPESHAEPWYKWHEDFVIKGNNGDDKEKTAKLEYTSHDGKTTYFTLTFKHVGITRIAPEKVEAGSENIRRVKIEMYVEDVSFDFSSAAAL